MTDRTLAILGKAPEPGKVKTRMIAGGLSPDQAAALQLACLRDTIGRNYGDVDRHLWRKGDPAAAIWAKAEAAGWECATQAHPNLGSNIIDALSAGLPGRAVVLGTDSPDLPSELIQEAWDALRSVDLVLGPSFDGGYYLIGAQTLEPKLFAGIVWGGTDVFEATAARAAALGISVHTLPFWYDLDEVADLRRLRLHSGLDRREQAPHRAKHVLRFLELNASAFGDPGPI